MLAAGMMMEAAKADFSVAPGDHRGRHPGNDRVGQRRDRTQRELSTAVSSVEHGLPAQFGESLDLGGSGRASAGA